MPPKPSIASKFSKPKQSITQFLHMPKNKKPSSRSTSNVNQDIPLIVLSDDDDFESEAAVSPYFSNQALKRNDSLCDNAKSNCKAKQTSLKRHCSGLKRHLDIDEEPVSKRANQSPPAFKCAKQSPSSRHENQPSSSKNVNQSPQASKSLNGSLKLRSCEYNNVNNDKNIEVRKSNLDTEQVSLKTNPLSSNINPAGKPQDSSSIKEVLDSKKELVKQSDTNIVEVEKDSLIETSTDNSSEDKTTTNEEDEYAVPYYLENFEFMVNHVLDEQFFAELLDEGDRKVIATFYDLSDSTRKLYVRLFGRNHRWIHPSKIVYPKIENNLMPNLQELVNAQLLQDENSMGSLTEVLSSLTANGLKALAKSLHINPAQPMKSLVAAILQHVNKPAISSFFHNAHGNSSKTMETTIFKRAKEQLGRCYRLEKTARSVFLRVIMLFAIHNTRGEDEELAVGQALMFQMLMTNIGMIKYPTYKIYRTLRVFEHRGGFIKFGEALQLEVNIVTALEYKKYEQAYDIYLPIRSLFRDHLVSPSATFDVTLPEFLRSYTAGAVYGRILTYGVEACQFLKRYEEAAELLEELLSQTIYNSNYRGRWYDRLTLNLDFHLKKPAEALESVKRGLDDRCVRKGLRYALFLRAQKICGATSLKLKRRWKEFEKDEMANVQDPPQINVVGRTINHGLPGTTSMYIKDDPAATDGFTILKRVEDVVLNFCELNGFPEGLHAEGSIFSFFMGLYMWEVLFAQDIPNVFYCLHQTFPLDFYHKEFYDNRKDLIDECLQKIREADEEELLSWLETSYNEHKDTYCIGVNWDLFRDASHAKGLISCIGGEKLAAILDRMIKDPRFTRGGMPDLVVWNPETKLFKVIEVKGPGDRLSTKQILWIDYMVQHGIDACVCYVQAVDVRRL